MKRKMNKEMISGMVVLVMFATFTVFAMPVAAQEVYLLPQNNFATYCNTTTVGIWVDATNFQSGQINLVYNSTCANVINWEMNPTLCLIGMWTHSVGSEWILFTSMVSTGLTGEYWIGNLTIHCNVSEEDCSTTLDFVTTGANPSKLFNPGGDEITGVDWTNGTFGCTVGICGDVGPGGGDGEIDMVDVVGLLNHVGNPDEYPISSQWAGDCKCSGGIDMGDVVLLLNHVSDSDGFPLECCV